ncbi:tetratricopeptide repeat protein [Gluconobacter albidus]|uniref:tetratricopeptide repeat protein n=1 Tax=Gluconobacter albidus TaxID=318683 RepID=UPI001B8CD6B1|nr:tetratricopeptide repeat protein [Gluconobacter albidus]MBS1028059.1 tetratricopeptide repeat protein [Gluconobacter albidus]
MVLSRSLRAVFLGTALSALSPVLPAVAQDAPDSGEISSREAIALQDQIASLRQQLSQVQNGGGLSAPSATAAAPVAAGDGNLTAQLLERVSALEEQNRQMRGELDQLSNSVRDNQANVSKQISDMQFASQSGGGAASAPPSAPASAKAPAAAEDKASAATPDTAEQPKTALDALKVGNASLRSGNYTDAESNARFAVKTAHSVSGKVDAQFLLAQSLAGQKQYRQSAVAYYDAYTKAPKSQKAQDSLLGVAASMLALGDKSSACQALDKLKSEFPTPAPRVKTAETTFRSRAACH